MLRPVELMSLRRKDIRFATRHGVPVAILAISAPKNKYIMGRSQFAVIYDPGTIAWLKWLAHEVPGLLKLWPSSRYKLVCVLNKVLELAELSELEFTLGSFRPGRVTDLFLSGDHPGTIKFQGRWKSDSAFSAYFQEAMSALVWSGLEPGLEDIMSNSLEEFAQVLLQAPTTPWTSLFSRKQQWKSLRADGIAKFLRGRP